jgi:hypothetical protein
MANAISIDRIREMRTEAAEAGDLDAVSTCDLAIEGDADATIVCARWARDADAQRDTELDY